MSVDEWALVALVSRLPQGVASLTPRLPADLASDMLRLRNVVHPSNWPTHLLAYVLSFTATRSTRAVMLTCKQWHAAATTSGQCRRTFWSGRVARTLNRYGQFALGPQKTKELKQHYDPYIFGVTLREQLEWVFNYTATCPISMPFKRADKVENEVLFRWNADAHHRVVLLSVDSATGAYWHSELRGRTWIDRIDRGPIRAICLKIGTVEITSVQWYDEVTGVSFIGPCAPLQPGELLTNLRPLAAAAAVYL